MKAPHMWKSWCAEWYAGNTRICFDDLNRSIRRAMSCGVDRSIGTLIQKKTAHYTSVMCGTFFSRLSTSMEVWWFEWIDKQSNGMQFGILRPWSKKDRPLYRCDVRNVFLAVVNVDGSMTTRDRSVPPIVMSLLADAKSWPPVDGIGGGW